MRRGAKPSKAKVGAKRPVASKLRKDEGVRVRNLEKRLAEALEQLQTGNRELAESREQQTATREILHVIIQSPTAVEPVFRAMAASAVRLCRADDAAIFQVEAGGLRLVAHEGAVALGPVGQFAVPLMRGSLTGRVALERRTIQIDDHQVEEVEYPEGTAIARRYGVRTMLGVPLLLAGATVGVIALRRTVVRPFTNRQVELLKTFADQAVIAIENVRLFNETREALERQTATSEILRVIASSPTDTQPVFDAIAVSATRLLHGWSTVVLRLEHDHLHWAAAAGGLPGSGDAIRGLFPWPVGRDEFIAQAIRLRHPVAIEDVQRDPSPSLREAAHVRGWRANLAVPMLREGEPIGLISVSRKKPGPYLPREIELMKTFADQAVIAIENVRLFTELQQKNRALTEAHTQVTEALERQTATAEILRIISHSQTNVQPVFDSIADNAQRLFRAQTAVVCRFDGELLHMGAQRGAAVAVPREQIQGISYFPMRPSSELTVGRCALTRSVVHTADVQSDVGASAASRTVGRTQGWRSALAVPMMRDQQLAGVVMVTRAEPGAFHPNEIELLQTFADQAVIAIENARLLSELQTRTQELTHSVEQLTALGEVSRALTSTLDLDAVLQTIVTRASQLAGTDACSVFEYDEATEAFHLRATHNLDDEIVAVARRTPIRKGDGVQGRMAITRQPVQIHDIGEGDAYYGPLRDVLLRTGTRALLAIPMLREDQLIGGLTVARKTPGEFSSEVIQLLQTFATQSALAIQNARLFREIEIKSRELQVASQHKSEFLANMSHELRTPLNAIIGFSEVLTERMFGDLNEKQEEYLKDIYASGQHLLSLINDILDLSKIEAGRMELELTDFDFHTAVDNALTLVRERAGRRGIALHQVVDRRLGQIRGDERKIKQVLLNLLSNALKFTPDGGRVDVQATVSDDMAEVSVSDTGVGIAPEDQEAVFEEFRQVGTADKKVEGTGLGLALSRKFIELHGGRIWVQSQVDVGSTFTFRVPVRHGE